MLPFQYQRFCLVESLTVIQNPHLMTSDSSGELDGHDANEQQMVLLLMIQYSGHRNSKWFRPHAQLDHHDTMWIRAQWPQHMKYVPWCSAACINCCDHVTSQALGPQMQWSWKNEWWTQTPYLFPDSYQNFTSIGKLNLFLSELNDKF